MKHRKLRIAAAVVLALAALAAVCAVELDRSAHSLAVTNYRIETRELGAPVRIVQLTDLHNGVFGDGNAELVDTVAAQNPDLIAITGDLLDSGSADTDIATYLIAQLSGIAPVYVSLGNHELEYEQTYGTDVTALYEDAGATVLDRSYADITVGGQAIRLGGIYGYCLPEKYLQTGEADEAECAFLRDFQDTDLYTVLLCHMPACCIVNDGISEWDIDCVFAGHAHGGQSRLPVVGGLWAPDQGWFPGQEAGLYYSGDRQKVMVLSRGLGSTEKIPRFNNIPEVVVTDLAAE